MRYNGNTFLKKIWQIHRRPPGNSIHRVRAFRLRDNPDNRNLDNLVREIPRRDTERLRVDIIRRRDTAIRLPDTAPRRRGNPANRMRALRPPDNPVPVPPRRDTERLRVDIIRRRDTAIRLPDTAHRPPDIFLRPRRRPRRIGRSGILDGRENFPPRSNYRRTN